MGTSSPRILVIDDQPVDRHLAVSVLKNQGFTLIARDSGVDCLKVIATEQPDLVLLDVVMPPPSGHEVLQQIRSKHHALALPVLMTTHLADSTEIVRALQLGANDYVTKPIDFEVVVRRIQTHLEVSRLNRELVRVNELEAVKALVATCNHEINTPLSVALAILQSMPEAQRLPAHDRLEKSLWRLAEIVRKLRDLTEAATLDYARYSGKTRTIKLK